MGIVNKEYNKLPDNSLNKETHLAEHDLKALREIQREMQELISNYGILKLEQYQLLKEMNSLQERITDVENTYDGLRQKEEALANRINQLYGNIQVNLESGEIVR